MNALNKKFVMNALNKKFGQGAALWCEAVVPPPCRVPHNIQLKVDQTAIPLKTFTSAEKERIVSPQGAKCRGGFQMNPPGKRKHDNVIDKVLECLLHAAYFVAGQADALCSEITKVMQDLGLDTMCSKQMLKDARRKRFTMQVHTIQEEERRERGEKRERRGRGRERT